MGRFLGSHSKQSLISCRASLLALGIRVFSDVGTCEGAGLESGDGFQGFGIISNVFIDEKPRDKSLIMG